VLIPAAISWWYFAVHVIVATGIAARYAQGVRGGDRSERQAGGINRPCKAVFIMQLVKLPTKDDFQRK